MGLSGAILAVPPLVYIDSCTFVAAFEVAPPSSDDARTILERLDAVQGVAVTSELTLAELLAPIARSGAMSIAERQAIYLPLLELSRSFTLVPISRTVLTATIPVRAEVPQRLPDAIHMATALKTGCRFFLSLDRHARRLPQSLQWLSPTPAGLRVLEAALCA